MFGESLIKENIIQIKKIFKIPFILLILIIVSFNLFAGALDNVICPYCGEKGLVIINDEDGLCQCSQCEEMLLILNGKIILKNGKKFNIKDFIDIDSLLDDNGDNTSDDGVSGGSKKNFRAELETYAEDEEDDVEQIEGYTEKRYLSYEPEEDEIIESETKVVTSVDNIASPSDFWAYRIYMKSKEGDIQHTIYYRDSDTDKIYDVDVVNNCQEFTTMSKPLKRGYKFVGWSLKPENAYIVKEKSPLIIANFNKNNEPVSKIYIFYAIWEKEESV